MTRVTGVEELQAVNKSRPTLITILTVSQLVKSLDRWSRALLPARYFRSSSLFTPAAAKLSILRDLATSPFWTRPSARSTGVALPGVSAVEDGLIGASSDMQKMMVSARLCTRSIGFFASKIFLLARASATVTDIEVAEATLPPTGTSAIVRSGT